VEENDVEKFRSKKLKIMFAKKALEKSISAVVVTYNSANHIIKLLKSLQNSELIRQIVIIENNSKEANKTLSIVSEYIQKNKIRNIEFKINSKNDGFGKSCNKGAALCNTKYILFINPDTKVNTDSIKILYDHCLTSNADLIGGKSYTFNGKRHLTVIRKPNLNIGMFEFSNLGKIFKTQRGHKDFYYLDNKKVINAKNDIEVDALGGAYLMVKKESYDKLGGFDEGFFMYLEDVDLSARAIERGMKVVYCPHSIIQHVGGASSDNKYKIRHQAWFDSRKYYFKKHFNFITNVVIQPLYTIEEYLLKRIKKI
jgi:GT2 family glycosyltransferase